MLTDWTNGDRNTLHFCIVVASIHPAAGSTRKRYVQNAALSVVERRVIKIPKFSHVGIVTGTMKYDVGADQFSDFAHSRIVRVERGILNYAT